MTASVVLYPATRPPAESAVVTVEAGDLTAHVGLLYRSTDNGARRHLHLAQHMRLENEPAAPARAFWVKPSLTEDDLDDVATAAHLVAVRYEDGSLPYAFDPKARFNSDGSLHHESLGLTCATFLMRLFDLAGIRLLAETTWDRERSAERKKEDIDVQRALVAYLRHKADPDHQAHADRVEREVGCTRFRAEEVAAASGMTGHPIPFARAEPEGRQVLAMIRKS